MTARLRRDVVAITMSPNSSISPPEGALRTPASKRISTPNAARLSTITEGTSHANANTNANADDDAPPIPPRSILRNSVSISSLPRSPRSFRFMPPWSTDETRASGETQRSPPPAYEWVPESAMLEGEDINPADDEKLDALRHPKPKSERQRGGWKRIALLAALLFLVVVGLAVGLGVGLTVGRRKDRSAQESDSTSPGANDDSDEQPFPMGEFSFLTALTNVSTSCTSNAATWSCYPSTVYSPSDPSTASRSLATFNWIISNTSSTYATINTPPTSSQGIPANLTLSSTSNPFGITFSAQPLTYISPSGNSSAARYTFALTMSKSVFPTTPITSENTATQCFFNSTTFTGSLYLSKTRTYPSEDTGSNFKEWPYAVEVSQSSPGGEDIPACYKYVSGSVGDRIPATDFAAASPDSQCACEYRNFV